MARVGDVIRVLRIKRGLTQEELARYTGLKRSAIGNYERGVREPDLDTIEVFADFFDVSVGDLMGRDDPPDQQPHQKPLTKEARILSAGIDRMPEEARKRAVSIMEMVFAEYADYFKDGDAND